MMQLKCLVKKLEVNSNCSPCLGKLHFLGTISSTVKKKIIYIFFNKKKTSVLRDWFPFRFSQNNYVEVSPMSSLALNHISVVVLMAHIKTNRVQGCVQSWERAHQPWRSRVCVFNAQNQRQGEEELHGLTLLPLTAAR